MLLFSYFEGFFWLSTTIDILKSPYLKLIPHGNIYFEDLTSQLSSIFSSQDHFPEAVDCFLTEVSKKKKNSKL